MMGTHRERPRVIWFALGLTLALIVGGSGPARAQYLYIDSNGDGLSFLRQHALGDDSPPVDCMSAGVLSVDVYYVTNQNADGGAATCTSGEPLTIGSYEFILGYSGAGDVTATGWTDNMGFTDAGISGGDGTLATDGQEIWVGRSGSEVHPPGTYKIGTLSVTTVGVPVLSFKTGSSGVFPAAQTLFASSCPGIQQDNKLRLGTDIPLSSAFPVSCFATDPVLPTTWGKIKQRYE